MSAIVSPRITTLSSHGGHDHTDVTPLCACHQPASADPSQCSVPRHLAPLPPAFGWSTGGDGSMSVRKLAKYGVRKRSLGAKDLGSGNTSGWVKSCFV